jgi:hypothetical protein
MSARIQNLTIVVVGALAVACSKPSTESARTAQVPASEPVPTLATPATGDQPLVSAVESSEKTELALVRPAERKPPQQVAVRGRANTPGGEAKGEHQHTVDLGEITPNVSAAAQAPSSDTPITMAMAPVPSGPSPSLGEGQGTGEAHHGGRGTLWQPDPPATIIIRGGMGGVDDDCKRHPNGYPGMGGPIAINQRMPQTGGPRVIASNPLHRPLIPGRTGGGMRGIR